MQYDIDPATHSKYPQTANKKNPILDMHQQYMIEPPNISGNQGKGTVRNDDYNDSDSQNVNIQPK